MAIEKIKIQGAVLELPIQPIYLKTGPNWPNQQCRLAGSSKTAPRILIFSIAMSAEYLSYVKSIATFVPKFYGYIISVLASVTAFTIASGCCHCIQGAITEDNIYRNSYC